MNILDKFRYKKDDPAQLNIELNQSSQKITSENKVFSILVNSVK